jgi:hypothetical protein
MKRLVLMIIGAITVTAFQNCGKGFASATTTMNESRGVDQNPDQISVGTQVYPEVDSEVTNPVPLNISQRASPGAVDFDANPAWVNGSMSWAYWLRSWKIYGLADLKYFGEPKFLYRLDLVKNVVWDLKTQTIVYTLSAVEAATLNSIFQGSILANAQDVGACAMTSDGNYATLETDYGFFELGSGSGCTIVDLFKNDNSGHVAGLEGFLTHLTTRL